MYLRVCSCFSFKTVRARVVFPSEDTEVFLLILFGDIDSFSESVNKKKEA